MPPASWQQDFNCIVDRYDPQDIAGFVDDRQSQQVIFSDLLGHLRGVIVGMTLVGSGVGELLHAATIAVVGEVPLGRLWHAVPAYPTMSELWLRLLEAFGL